MYCIINNNNNTYITGNFITVINSTCKWYIKDTTLHYKFNGYEAETYDIVLDWMNNNETHTLVMNYLWNQLERFNYIRFKYIK